LRPKLPSMRLMRRKPDNGPREIEAEGGDALTALDALPLLAIGVALGIAGVLVAAFFSKILSRDTEG